MAKAKTFTVAKVFVVNQQGELLVLRRSKTDVRRPLELDFPGGWVDAGEQPLDAAVREAREEAGIRITDPHLIYGTSAPTEHGSGTWLVYMAHVVGTPEVTLSHEHCEYQWMRPTDLLADLTYERQQAMVRYAVDNHLLD